MTFLKEDGEGNLRTTMPSATAVAIVISFLDYSRAEGGAEGGGERWDRMKVEKE